MSRGTNELIQVTSRKVRVCFKSDHCRRRGDLVDNGRFYGVVAF